MPIYDVVKFERDLDDWLLYKYPETEFNTKSKLIVSTSQVAILVHNGKIEKICEEGKYNLDTELLPFVKEFVKMMHGGKNPYPLEIYFLNKRIKLDFLWGTTDPIVILDPIYNIQLKIRARGQLGIKLNNYQFLIEGLVGSLMTNSYVSYKQVSVFFRGLLNQKIKKVLSSCMLQNKISYFEINTHLDEIEKAFFDEIKDEIVKLGFSLINMSVESINVPDDNLNELNKILHKKVEYEQLGDNLYRTSRGYDVLEAGAKNNSSVGSIIGLGLGGDIVNGSRTNSIIPDSPQQEANSEIVCPKCNVKVPSGSKFCPNCGEKLETYCPHCGAKLTSVGKFCSSCGKKLSD